MEDSILLSVKKNLGIADENETFDRDLVLLINSSFSTLNQLGIGPEKGFSIEDEAASWSDFIDDDRLNGVKEYVYIDVRLSFDPPTASTLSSFNDRRNELGWRMMIAAEDIAQLSED